MTARDVIDICYFAGALALLALIGLSWVSKDPKEPKDSVPFTWVAVPASVLLLAFLLGSATCVWGGVSQGRGICAVKFSKGQPLDPVKDYLWIQAVYGAIFLMALLVGLLITVAVLRAAFRRGD